MPHAELRYSNDVAVDTGAVFGAIETTIARHDDGAGVVKCRAYPTADYRHSHLTVLLTMLDKPHRDTAFTTALISDLEAAVKAHIRSRCYFSLQVDFNPPTYVTNEHIP